MPVGVPSDEAVKAATGRTWAEWYARLDEVGAAARSHKEIVAILRENHDLSAWWQQSIAVNYEKARGLRQEHQKPSGFEISRSKTVSARPERVFTMFSEEDFRRAWLGNHPMEVRTANAHRSLRFTWGEDGTIVAVMFMPKGEARCQVSVNHGNLPDAEAAGRMKAFWGEALGRLERELA